VVWAIIADIIPIMVGSYPLQKNSELGIALVPILCYVVYCVGLCFELRGLTMNKQRIDVVRYRHLRDYWQQPAYVAYAIATGNSSYDYLMLRNLIEVKQDGQRTVMPYVVAYRRKLVHTMG